MRSSRLIGQPPEEWDEDEEPNPPRLVPDDVPIDRLVPEERVQVVPLDPVPELCVYEGP